MPRVVHFEIMADSPETTVNFYSDVFGWKTQKWDGPSEYWLVDTGEGMGINGGVARKNEGAPGIINTIDVDSVDEYCQKIESAGGKVVQPKMEIEGVGYLAYAVDPEGNMFGIMEGMSGAQSM